MKPFFLCLVSFVFLSACSENAVKRQFLQAEKLWSEEHYQASVKEFESLVRNESQGEEEPLVTQALFRSAMTQTLYLNQHEEALQKFELFLKRKIPDDQKKQVELEMGEILFSRIKNYERAYNHYDGIHKDLLTKEDLYFVKFRQARCLHFLWKFPEAILLLESLIKDSQQTTLNQSVYIELANIYLTYSRLPQNTDTKSVEYNHKSIHFFDEYLKKYPEGTEVAQALFGLSMAYEQLDQLDISLLKLEEAEKKFPNHKLIALKKERLKDRMIRRKR